MNQNTNEAGKLSAQAKTLDYIIADNAAAPFVGISVADEERVTVVSWDLPVEETVRAELELLVIGSVAAANTSGEPTVSGLLTACATHCKTRRVDGVMTAVQQVVYDRLVAKAGQIERKMPDWTPVDSHAADQQGWNVFNLNESRQHAEIQRDDEAGQFATDEEAIEFVQLQAKAGDVTAAKALKLAGLPVPEVVADRKVPVIVNPMPSIKVRADGDANFYHLIEDNDWVAAIHLNGKFTTPMHEAMMQKFADALMVETPRELPSFKVMLTLRSACGCVGQGILGTGQPLTWDVDPVNETVLAIFSRIDVDTLHVVEVVEMDGEGWREFEDSNAEASLVANVANGHSLEAALDGVPASTCAPSPGM